MTWAYDPWFVATVSGALLALTSHPNIILMVMTTVCRSRCI